ncbi:transposase [Candidatus Tisiphia endosymbiont of Beris chalybata]|uniref:transposase n=1 Tax=Candidatus Tisiphia endosymbiont of Beris chalybata TaxID=3066262 RepID=UPI00312C9949
MLQGNRQRIREGKLSLSEAISIMIFYHFSPYKNLKLYYNSQVIKGTLFSNPPCYDRFIQLILSLFIPLIVMMHYLSGNKTGIYYVDSTYFAVCKNIRITSHKTFAGLAARGHSSIDYFYGFTLHMIINNHSEIVAIKITRGNVDDRKASKRIKLLKVLKALKIVFQDLKLNGQNF